MCPDNDGLRWLVKTVARGQLRRGGSLPARPGAAGVPRGGISRHPPERRSTTLFRKPRAPWDAPTPPASSPVPAAATAQPGWLSQRRPHICSQNVSRGRETSGRQSTWEGREDGGGFAQAASSWTKHILEAPVPPSGPLLLPRGNISAWPQRHGVDAILEPGRRRLPRDPRRRQPLAPPSCGKLSKQADGAGERRQRGGEQKRLFSHATYFTSRTFCAFQPCL